jgi:NADP-dependent aldehyde dehydrogenase
MMVPLGPVLVFGASNFPFAYSTAGGDTASALAAGCPVIVKAHPAHPKTGDLVAAALHRGIARAGLPTALFTHIHGELEIGETLVKHPLVKAVGFTGSLSGGRQLYDWGAARKEPIPVFAEMGSVNPVYLFPAKMETDAADMAMKYAQSITASAGQVCTNPGLIIGVSGGGLELFLQTLREQILHIKPEPMLHTGIYKAYVEKRAAAISQEGVDMEAVSTIDAAYEEASPTIAVTDAGHFLANPLLHQEVFGPYSLVIRCRDMAEMEQVADAMEGQLTSAIIATPEEVITFDSLVDKIRSACGRMIFNGVPTGVEVCLSMQHGGPYPACTDSRFTAVGGDALKRFARPVTYQNWPEELLPDELKTSNPLNLVRTVNNEPGRH